MTGAAAIPETAFLRHGGRMAAALASYPEAPRPWIDLSTGINPRPYPAPRGDPRRLPDPEALTGLEAVAARAFGADPASVAAVPGSEAAIRLLPRLLEARTVAVGPRTYGGHAEAWVAAGVEVREAPASADALVVVNPNNPDGRLADRPGLIAAAAAGDWVIVDEAFADADPRVSLAPVAGGRLIVLRSFGKFYGLPGLRLGFVVADPAVIAQVRAALGDWPVSVHAIAAGTAAYADAAWADRARRRLAAAAIRLDTLLAEAGLAVVGGTTLFRLARAPDAPRLFLRLAEGGILCRPFAYDAELLRFGLPGSPAAWVRLRSALVDGR